MLTASTLLASAATADELFSRIKTDAVFAPSSSSTPIGKPGDITDKSDRIATLTQLHDRLRDSGLEPLFEKEEAVNISLQHSRWTFSIRLELVDQAQKVLIHLGLESADKSPLSAERLLGLLAANSQIRPACFTFSIPRKRLELSVPIANENLSARALREELRNLAGLAEKTAPAWEVTNPTTNSATNPPTNTPAPVPNTAPSQTKPAPSATVSAGSLVGKWAANRANAESFTLHLGKDGAFELTHVRNGRSIRSVGRFDVSGRQLTLTGSDKVKIVGEISSLGVSSFEFTPRGAAAARLTFQKAS